MPPLKPFLSNPAAYVVPEPSPVEPTLAPAPIDPSPVPVPVPAPAPVPIDPSPVPAPVEVEVASIDVVPTRKPRAKKIPAALPAVTE